MDTKAIAKGLTAGAAVGFALYAYSSMGSFKKHSIKRNAEKTLKAAENLLNDLTDSLK